MKLKILGSNSPYLKGNNNCPGYFIIHKCNKILLDCGNGISRLMQMPNDLENLIIVISHLHRDHYGELLTLSYSSYVYHNLGLLNARVKVYLPKPNNEEEELDYNYLVNLSECFMEFIPYDDKTTISMNDMQISFKKNPHPVTTYSVKIKDSNNTIVYSADTGYKNNTLVQFAYNADLLICEATFLKHQKDIDNHLSAYEAGMIAKKANVEKLVLTHFWPEINSRYYVKEAKRVFNKTIAAKENKVLKLGGRKWR